MTTAKVLSKLRRMNPGETIEIGPHSVLRYRDVTSYFCAETSNGNSTSSSGPLRIGGMARFIIQANQEVTSTTAGAGEAANSGHGGRS